MPPTTRRGLTVSRNSCLLRRKLRIAVGSNENLPRVIGHEIAGDVVELGAGVTSFKQGDRVNVFYHLTFGDCRWCNLGRNDLCDNHAGYVGRQIDGGLAESL